MNLHAFQFEDRKFVFAVDFSRAFEVDGLTWKMMQLSNTMSDRDIIQQLSYQYELAKIVSTLQEMRSFRSTGFLAGGLQITPDRIPPQRYTLSLNTIHRCDLRCEYCFSGGGANHSENGKKMSRNLAKRAVDFLVDEFAQNGKPRALSLTAGGEPLLNFDLFLFLKDYCEKKGKESRRRIPCGFTTNGVGLTSKVMDTLEKMRQSIRISIDGPNEVHDAMRCFPSGEGSYEVIAPKIEAAVKRNLITGACVTLTPIYTDFVGIITHLLDLGFKEITMKPVRSPTGSYAITSENVEEIRKGYDTLGKFLVEQTLLGHSQYIKAILNPGDFLGRFLIRTLGHHRLIYRCNAGKGELSVTATGDLYPCSSFVGIEAFKMGNINQGMDLRRRGIFFDLIVDRKNPCRECWARYLCGGGCYYAAYLANGRIDQPDRTKCRLIQHLIELSIWIWTSIKKKKPNWAKQLEIDLMRQLAGKSN